MHRTSVTTVLIIAACLGAKKVHAFRLNDVSPFGLGVVRWNADPHFVEGVERSLDGGLRYSLQGGSYAAYRDLFQWHGTPPTVAEFQTAVEQSFAAWEVIDPATGLGTDLKFVPDLSTPVVQQEVDPVNLQSFLRFNPGAEIDLLADFIPAPGIGVAELFGDPNSSSVTLTSGTTNVPAYVLSGVDIVMNTRAGRFPWRLEQFQSTLTHEIGHAIGLNDVDYPSPGIFGVSSLFYDDNFDDTSDETARATLSNSFADLIDPFDPENSPGLKLFEPCAPSDDFSCASRPGLKTPGVNLLMEGDSPPVDLLELQNDDFAARQFYYPFVVVPEPSSVSLLGMFVLASLLRRRSLMNHRQAIGTPRSTLALQAIHRDAALSSRAKPIEDHSRCFLATTRNCALLVLFGLANGPLHAEVTFDWATVGNPANASDQLYAGRLNPGNLRFGSVDYIYRISKYEVTNSQYVEFLNAVALSDPNGLFDPDRPINRGGVSGSFSYAVIPGYGSKPVYVSYLNSMRFVNWLENGQPTGAQTPATTEDGVYKISDGSSETRAASARFFIPSEDEWYKAAYYDPRSAAAGGPPGDDNYWLYPTQSDIRPFCSAPPGAANSANCGVQVGRATPVGAYASSTSFYGTFDQAGNVDEWTESVHREFSVVRGGNWERLPIGRPPALAASVRFFGSTGRSGGGGLRVASIPEPSALHLGAMAAIGLLARRRWLA